MKMAVLIEQHNTKRLQSFSIFALANIFWDVRVIFGVKKNAEFYSDFYSIINSRNKKIRPTWTFLRKTAILCRGRQVQNLEALSFEILTCATKETFATNTETQQATAPTVLCNSLCCVSNFYGKIIFYPFYVVLCFFYINLNYSHTLFAESNNYWSGCCWVSVLVANVSCVRMLDISKSQHAKIFTYLLYLLNFTDFHALMNAVSDDFILFCKRV